VADAIADGVFQRHNALKTHCRHGHEYTKENTYVRSNGRRSCKTCVLKGVRERYLRTKFLALGLVA
jgi:hypothetical protein